MLTPYLDQLETAARANEVSLRKAFADAGVPTSSLYRARRGGDLHVTTAQRVMKAITNGEKHGAKEENAR